KSALAVCQSRAAHVVSIKATKMGSLDEGRSVFEVCRTCEDRAHVGGSAGPALVDIAQAHLAASLEGMDEECEVDEFQALTGDPTTGATIKSGYFEISMLPGWGLNLSS